MTLFFMDMSVILNSHFRTSVSIVCAMDFKEAIPLCENLGVYIC
jgi:hypothetical protein